MVQVFHYITGDGRDPFGEWLLKQNINVVARIQQRIDRMRRGNFGDHRGLDSGLLELRIDYGPWIPGLLWPGWTQHRDPACRWNEEAARPRY